MRNLIRNKISLVTALAVLLSTCPAFAWGGRGGGHYYSGGHYYERGWFGFGVVAAALTLGAIVATLPEQRNVVVVNGYPYYSYDNVYYQQCPSGYVVVAPPNVVQPVVVQQQQPVVQTVVAPATVVSQSQPAMVPAAPAAGEFPVNILNSDGKTYTAVLIRQKGNGYVGPQGEFYPAFPKVEQLKAMYAK
jgi:hypothetical protein